MTLPEYIREVGDEAAARTFRAPLRTVQSWRRQERFPRLRRANEIVALTDGVVSLGGIYCQDPAASMPCSNVVAAESAPFTNSEVTA